MTDHERRNVEQVAVLRSALLGSGYRPKVWCVSHECYKPLEPSTAVCPHCQTAQPDALELRQ